MQQRTTEAHAPDVPRAETTQPVDSSRATRLRRAVPWIAFAATYGLFPIVFDTPYAHNVGVLVCLTAIMASGWNVLGGMTGQISLGHAMFFGIGAYSTAVAGATFGVNPWIGILAGVGLSVLLSALIGLPVFRLQGHYFSIATIALGEILLVVFLNWRWVGAATGLSIPLNPDDSFLALQFSGRLKWEYYYLALALLTGVLTTISTLMRTRAGRYLDAIRQDEVAAASLGIPVLWYKQLAFAYSAIVVALAGGFYAQYVLFVDPDSAFALTISITITIAAVLGGVRSMWGPVLGAAILILLTEATRLNLGGTGGGLNLVVYGLLVMVIAAFEPNGLLGLGARVRALATKVRR